MGQRKAGGIGPSGSKPSVDGRPNSPGHYKRPTRAEWQAAVPNLKEVGDELNGPCPACGGTDRFYVLASGRAFCRRCCPDGSDPQRYKALLEAAGLTGAAQHKPNGKDSSAPPAQPPHPPPNHSRQTAARKLWRHGSPVEPGTASHAYFHQRLRWPLTKFVLPKAVRCAPARRVPMTLPEEAAHAILFGLKPTPKPAPAQALEIEAITAQGTLTEPRFRRTLGAKKGAALWIPGRRNGGDTRIVAVAEGPLDALAVSIMAPFHLAVASMGTAALKSFALPLETRSVQIWADGGQAGTEAARHLADRLQKVDLAVHIIEPTPPAQDPAEELIRRYAGMHKEAPHV